MNPSSEDPSAILTEEGQWTEPWGSSDDGSPCDKCGGAGRAAHECWSCKLDGASDSCPVCQGRVNWEAECPVCRGTGEVDGKPRRGVSVFPRLQGLYHYMEAKGADLEDCLIVELDGEPSGDLDFDADQGAMLVIPTKIVACCQADDIDRFRARGHG
jgi:DnaJ-class molecular chaperone